MSRILCENIRREINNKFILIGVYSGGIIVQSFPAQLDLAFYVEAKFKSPGEKVIHFKISGPEGEMAKFSTGLTVDKEMTAALHSPQMQVSFPQPGTFIVEISDDDEIWCELIKKEIRQGDVPGFIPIADGRPPSQSPSGAQG